MHTESTDLIMTGQASTRTNRWLQPLLVMLLLLVSVVGLGQSDYVINPSAQVVPPINANFTQMITLGNVRATFTVNGFGGVSERGYSRGRIERLAGGTPFSLTTSPNYTPQVIVVVNRGTALQLNQATLRDAFGNFSATNLQATGININTLLDGNGNLVLPEGTYRFCMEFLDFNLRLHSQPDLGCGTFVVPSATPTNGVQINTRFIPPANPEIITAISRGNVQPTVIFTARATGDGTRVKVFGKIESLSPKPFTIALRNDYNLQQPITLLPMVPVTLNSNQVLESFGNFNEGDLVTTGISLAELRQSNGTVRLPEGLYRICFYARYFDGQMLGDNASNINLGCTNFNICYKAGAPQFTQPVSNFNLSSQMPSVRMASPVIFSWTPPIATCGLNLSALSYDFEIREMFEGQTITDAINNPPVFFKNGLRSPTYLLDTILYKQVLQRGHRYVIRVKANAAPDAPILIDNDGYSRIQGFVYGEAPLITQTVPGRIDVVRQTPVKSLITTSVLKGRAVWSFKKAEEELVTLSTDFAAISPGAAVLVPTNLPGTQTVNNAKTNIDPNLRLAAGNTIYTGGGTTVSSGINTTINASNNTSPRASTPTQSTAPQQMLLSSVTGDGVTTEIRDLKIPSTNGKIVHPLAGARILLKGVKAPAGTPTQTRVATDSPSPAAPASLATQLGVINYSSPGVNVSSTNGAYTPSFATNYLMVDESKLDEDLIGSATADAAGNFTLSFIDPKFRNITKYTKLHVVVEQADFEPYSRFIPVSAPTADGDIDLGDVQLLAKTFRFTPSIEGFSRGVKINVYTPAKTFNSKPYYAFMLANSSSPEKKTIAGKEYVKVATVGNGQTLPRLFYQHGYYDNMIVQINAEDKEQYSSYMGIVPVSYSSTSAFAPGLDESRLVISVKKKYTLKKQLPYISGKVEMFVEDRANSANSFTMPGAGAVVTVTFDKSKVIEEYKETVVGEGGTAPPGTAVINGVVTGNVNVSATGNRPIVNSGNSPAVNSGSRPVVNSGSRPATGGNVRAVANAPVGARPVAGATTAVYGNPYAANSNVREVAYANPVIADQVKTLFRYSATADSNGYYRIDKLPVLADGAFFTVTVKSKDGMDSARATDKPLARGDYAEMNFQFRPEVYTVTGIAVDEEGTPLPSALLVWKSGGSPIEANSHGLFVTSNYKDDSITIKNQGYIDRTIFIRLNKSKPKNPVAKTRPGNGRPLVILAQTDVNAWATNLVTQPSVVAAFSNSTSGAPAAPGRNAPANPGNAPRPAAPQARTGTQPTAAAFGHAVYTPSDGALTLAAQLGPMYNQLFNPGQLPAGSVDVGKVGYLVKGSSRIKFVVSDATAGTKVPNAIITIDETFDTTTNATGEVIYKGGGSAFSYSVKGASGSDYITQTGEMGNLPVDGSVTTVNVSLDHGVKLSGKVTSKGANIKDAEIFVDGKEYITAKSKTDGTYELFVPKGESIVKATKPGYVGKQVSKTFTSASVENFELGDGGGHDISKLLGFAIELESQVPDGAGEKWTGSFVNLQANSVFSIAGNKKLKFTNVKVTFNTAGKPVVAGNEVKTDITELGMKLFSYIPVTIKGSPQITVREEIPGKGSIGGKLQLNLDQIPVVGGFLFATNFKPLLALANTAVDKDVPVFTSDGSTPSALTFVFSNARESLKQAADKAVADFQPKVDKATGDGKATLVTKLNEFKTAASGAVAYTTGTSPIPPTLDQYVGIEVYGFQGMINLAKCKVDATGLDLAGFVLSPDIPILSSMFFDIERLKIGTDFSIKDISVKSNLHVKFSIASWSAEINSVAFNMRGFKVGGKIEVQVPASPKNTLEFADLAFGTSGLYGGSFSFPGDGLNIFNIINLKTGGIPLSFGQIGNTGVYKLGGSAKFSFGKMFTESIDVPYFQVQTNGQFGVTVPVNRSLNAGFAKFSLKSITFNTTTPTPQVDLDGQFSVDVKMLKLSTGGIHFRTTGVTVDKIGLGLDIPGTKVDGFVDIKPNGFAGGGSLSIVGTPVKVAIDFHYYKTNGDVDLGASFIAGVKIPIGPVIITKVGGGFSYRSADNYFMVNITGGASITGFEELISLDPISITVESGPKIVGEAHLKVASLDVAKASLIIDIPNEYFAVGVVADFQPLPDIVSAHIQGDLIISTKSSDTYFFLGAGMHVSLLGLINSEGVFALGVGVKDAKTRETISYYMQKAPDAYLSNGSFTGIYINSITEMGVKEENAPELDLGIVSGKIWLYSRTDFSLIANFKNANFRIAAGMAFEGGVKACIVGICAGASAKACVNIAGGYLNDLGWNFDASASGEAQLSIGDDCGCNDICIGLFYAGGKICVGAGAKIVYQSKRGGLRELSMFLGQRSNCP